MISDCFEFNDSDIVVDSDKGQESKIGNLKVNIIDSVGFDDLTFIVITLFVVDNLNFVDTQNRFRV